jgi:hypothetical protein
MGRIRKFYMYVFGHEQQTREQGKRVIEMEQEG